MLTILASLLGVLLGFTLGILVAVALTPILSVIMLVILLGFFEISGISEIFVYIFAFLSALIAVYTGIRGFAIGHKAGQRWAVVGKHKNLISIMLGSGILLCGAALVAMGLFYQNYQQNRQFAQTRDAMYQQNMERKGCQLIDTFPVLRAHSLDLSIKDQLLWVITTLNGKRSGSYKVQFNIRDSKGNEIYSVKNNISIEKFPARVRVGLEGDKVVKILKNLHAEPSYCEPLKLTMTITPSFSAYEEQALDKTISCKNNAAYKKVLREVVVQIPTDQYQMCNYSAGFKTTSPIVLK